jgi:hypothetical protein
MQGNIISDIYDVDTFATIPPPQQNVFKLLKVEVCMGKYYCEQLGYVIKVR